MTSANFITDPIAETTDLIKTSSTAIRVLGPMTVIAFILVGFLIFLVYKGYTISEIHTQIQSDIVTVKTNQGSIETNLTILSTTNSKQILTYSM